MIDSQELPVILLVENFITVQEVGRELLLVHYLRKSICDELLIRAFLAFSNNLVMNELEKVEVFLVVVLVDDAMLVDVEQHLLLLVHRVVVELSEADHLNYCRDVQLVIVLLRSIFHQFDLSIPLAAALEHVHLRKKVEIVGDEEDVPVFEDFAERGRCRHKRLDGLKGDFRHHARFDSIAVVLNLRLDHLLH